MLTINGMTWEIVREDLDWEEQFTVDYYLGMPDQYDFY